MQRWLQEALRAGRIVADAGGDEASRSLRAQAMRRLPLLVVDLHSLTTTQVQDWLSQRAIAGAAMAEERELHGCVVARRGSAIIFISADDPTDEAEFTFAHELAHFIIDCLVPRDRALNTFGESIRPVLDGLRAATKEELLGAALIACRWALRYTSCLATRTVASRPGR